MARIKFALFLTVTVRFGKNFYGRMRPRYSAPALTRDSRFEMVTNVLYKRSYRRDFFQLGSWRFP